MGSDNGLLKLKTFKILIFQFSLSMMFWYDKNQIHHKYGTKTCYEQFILEVHYIKTPKDTIPLPPVALCHNERLLRSEFETWKIVYEFNELSYLVTFLACCFFSFILWKSDASHWSISNLKSEFTKKLEHKALMFEPGLDKASEKWLMTFKFVI